MRTSTFAFLAASSLSTITSAFTFKSETIIATLDDLNASLPNPSAFTKHPSVGVYNQLLWQGFSVNTPATPQAEWWDFTGIEPHSEPNYASAPVVPDFFLPGLSTSYPGSKVVFFDLDKFFWGCSTPDIMAAVGSEKTLPGWCSLEILAYSHDSPTPTARASSFYFPAEGTKRMEMIYAGLPTAFKAITRVEFKVDADTPNPVFYLDNVQYNVYEVTDMGNGIGEVIHQQTAAEGVRGQIGGQAALQVLGPELMAF